MYLIPEIDTFLAYFEMGGFVMLPLLLVAVILWYALAYRALRVGGNSSDPRKLINKARKHKGKSMSITAQAARFAVDTAASDASHNQIKSLINVHFASIRADISQYKTLVRSLVGVAPLLGLLGTVDGMIETFDSLGDMALFTQTGGIAGGISKALFTTQMGLAVSIPGLLFGRMIERKEREISRELDQIRDLVCTQQT